MKLLKSNRDIKSCRDLKSTVKGSSLIISTISIT